VRWQPCVILPRTNFMPESNNQSFIIGIIAITVIIFAGLVWALVKTSSNSPSVEVKDEQVSFSDDNDPVVGSTSSTAVVHIYGDFQCPACRIAEPGLRYAMDKYQDQVRFVWKDFPLMNLHKNARGAAEAARCAQAQGKFWEYHNKLYDTQTDWAQLSDPKQTFLQYGNDVGLNAATFDACASAQAEDSKVSADISEGNQNHVDATPTFFINHRRYFAMTPQEWDAAMQKALSK